MMRLWHEDLIRRLPAGQLLGQHRECCALRGNGWGRKHSVVDYVFAHSPYKLFQYHQRVMVEMAVRGYRVSPEWRDPRWRGRSCAAHTQLDPVPLTIPIYPEHDPEYLAECLVNLREKGVDLGV